VPNPKKIRFQFSDWFGVMMDKNRRCLFHSHPGHLDSGSFHYETAVFIHHHTESVAELEAETAAANSSRKREAWNSWSMKRSGWIEKSISPAINMFVSLWNGGFYPSSHRISRWTGSGFSSDSALTFWFESAPTRRPPLTAAENVKHGIPEAWNDPDELKNLSIITPNQSLNWKRIFFGFGTYFLLMFMAGLIDFYPDELKNQSAPP
jgi:hypothetical protein